jgi:hypothetical protein
MSTIHVDIANVPAHLRTLDGYTGRKFKMVSAEHCDISAHDGYWSGGSRVTHFAVRLADGAILPLTDTTRHPLNVSATTTRYPIVSGIAIVAHSIFCGKDSGLTFYIHPTDIVPLLPASVELTPHEKIVLAATSRYKSSYAGQSRYQQARYDFKYYNLAEKHGPFPTMEQWEATKESLVSKGLLNRAGAITPAGKNANTVRIFM